MRTYLRGLLVGLALALPLAARAAAPVWWGPGSFQVLYPSGDNSLSNWSVTGAATVWDATNDALDVVGWPSATDNDSTYAGCAGSTVCSVILDLTNTSGLSGKKILYVTAVGAVLKTSGAGTFTTQLSLRVSGVDYLTNSPASSSTSTPYTQDVVPTTTYYTNPATSLAWTTTDLDALQLTLGRATGAQVGKVTSVAVIVAYEDDPYTSTRERSGGGD